MNRPRTALKTDLYQLTMAAGYFAHGLGEKRVSFEVFFRQLPPKRRFMMFAGLETCLRYLRTLRFDASEIEYLSRVPALRKAMSFEFQEFLRGFRFRGDVTAMAEGTICFANEPLLRITGTLIEAQLVETFLLSAINTESVVASKAARIVGASGEATLLEFGSRRTSAEEAVASARAAYLAGFDATSNVEAGYRFDIPVAGTAAHSWTMAHGNETQAFENYVSTFSDRPILLVDTYDTLEGTKRAIDVAGDRLGGVRLDSGDLLALSQEVRKLLDESGLANAIIVASGDLNEYEIARLRSAGAPINAYGVGTELVRSRDNPTLGGVYKLVYDHSEGRAVAKQSQGKVTLPGLHQVFRKTVDGVAERDIVGTHKEFHVDGTPLLEPWLEGGELSRVMPSIAELRAHARAQLASLPANMLKLDDEGGAYPVTNSDGLLALIEEVRSREAA